MRGIITKYIGAIIGAVVEAETQDTFEGKMYQELKGHILTIIRESKPTSSYSQVNDAVNQYEKTIIKKIEAEE